MSIPVVLDDVAKGAPTCSERAGLSHATSCTTAKEFLDTITNGQAMHVSDEIAVSRVCELVVLRNGDFYSGALQGGLPEGSGKYIWSDGCSYAGEWRIGMRHGKGKMSWPSGAVYEGEFFSGYVHGTGTYIGSDQLTYKGCWKLNFKHGLGYQTFPNGDTFEGSWINGNIEGAGKYVWANGNIFIGNMKGGKMSGKGTLSWKNGDSFEGNWLDGMMHGSGVYTWNDGSCFIGTWTRGLKDGKGAFYPKGSWLPATQEVYVNALRKRGMLPNLKRLYYGSHILHSSSVSMRNMNVKGIQLSGIGLTDDIPSGSLINLKSSCTQNASLERGWSLEVAIEKVIGYDRTKNIAESSQESDERVTSRNFPILEREYMQGVLISELIVDNVFPSSSKRVRRQQKKMENIKRPGETIIKGHRSYDLMLSLQLGIRYTVGKITPIQRREVRASDFGRQASFWMDFPNAGSKLTPSHRSEDFKWKDYCPMVFRNLREMFKIDAADYMISICGNNALRELSSPGKSGSVFFLSQDDRFMIKTLRKHEVQVLLQMLPDYHHHVRTNENTLVTKFFGLHRVKPSSGQKFRFVVMGNMFCTELRIHKRFDLKGSSLGRSADKVKIDENTILKDLDLNYWFYLEPSWRDALLKQIEIDSKFLKRQHIMDYSLLLGVHHRAPQHMQSHLSQNRSAIGDRLVILTEGDVQEDEQFNYPEGLVLVPRGQDENSVVVGPHSRGSRLRASAGAGDEEVDLLLPGTARLQIQLGVNMPARAERMIGKEGKAQVFDVVLYLGIIDILQDYNMRKKIEHAFKSLHFESCSISAVDPDFYSTRFLRFIQSVFPENTVTM